jgi:hypothetical protein
MERSDAWPSGRSGALGAYEEPVGRDDTWSTGWANTHTSRVVKD